MLISEKTTGSIYLFIYLFCVKRSVSDSETIRKNEGEKSASESSKMRDRKTNLGSLGPPPLGHLSVKMKCAL